jgi:hypothetical protein
MCWMILFSPPDRKWFNFYYCPKNGFCWMQSSICESCEWRKTIIMNPCLWTHVMSKQEVHHLLLPLLMGVVSNLTSVDICILYDSDWVILLILQAYHTFAKMSVIERFNGCSSGYNHGSFNYLFFVSPNTIENKSDLTHALNTHHTHATHTARKIQLPWLL